MNKKNLLLSFILSLISISFVSAQYFRGYSFENFLYSIDPSLAILGSIFLLSLFIFNFALSRTVLRENKVMPPSIALILAFLVIYSLNKFGWDYQRFFYNLGLSESLLSGFGWIIIVIAIIFLGMKIGFQWALMGMGTLLVLMSIYFTEFIEYPGFFFLLGPILVAIGLYKWWKSSKKKKIFEIPA